MKKIIRILLMPFFLLVALIYMAYFKIRLWILTTHLEAMLYES